MTTESQCIVSEHIVVHVFEMVDVIWRVWQCMGSKSLRPENLKILNL